MRSPILYLKNFVVIGIKKIRYMSRFSAGMIQTFDKLHVEIHGSGRVKLGSFNQNRGNLYLVADGGELIIGDHCFFNTGTCITTTEQIIIGDNCKIGNNVVIVDHDHNFKNDGEKEFISSKIEIGQGTWIGANVTILRGTKIGPNAVIGAGSVIKGVIPEGGKVIQKRV